MLGALSAHDGEALIPMWALAHRQKWAGRTKLRLRLARRGVRMTQGAQQVRMSDDLQQGA
jgi:hypothetical protein